MTWRCVVCSLNGRCSGICGKASYRGKNLTLAERRRNGRFKNKMMMCVCHCGDPRPAVWCDGSCKNIECKHDSKHYKYGLEYWNLGECMWMHTVLMWWSIRLLFSKYTSQVGFSWTAHGANYEQKDDWRQRVLTLWPCGMEQSSYAFAERRLHPIIRLFQETLEDGPVQTDHPKIIIQ